ncbi:RDD family protein [Elstera cyanobacteriorum]|uniref:RDD family protein n=1 Tax=Elstera cyanobacteriorum TaxID=2022747 RepID=UPI002355327B|nr:RDD family protein [Elstera cyanobacteriorum]MCK6441792.1 RDD family protein [Elstera cyanobacteriorum]
MGQGNQAPVVRRLLAGLIDLLAVALLVTVIGLVLSVAITVGAASEAEKQGVAFWGARLILVVIPWLYFARLERGLGYQTFGKSALGLQVQRTDGQALGFARAALRAPLKLFLGWTWPLVLIGQPPLYDRLLSTQVVARPA